MDYLQAGLAVVLQMHTGGKSRITLGASKAKLARVVAAVRKQSVGSVEVALAQMTLIAMSLVAYRDSAWRYRVQQSPTHITPVVFLQHKFRQEVVCDDVLWVEARDACSLAVLACDHSLGQLGKAPENGEDQWLTRGCGGSGRLVCALAGSNGLELRFV